MTVRKALVALLVSVGPAVAQQVPLPEPEAFFTAARENLARAGQAQRRYAYKERRTELHRNPFGRIGTGGIVVSQVTPGDEPGVTWRLLLERDGKPVADATPQRSERRRRAFSIKIRRIASAALEKNWARLFQSG